MSRKPGQTSLVNRLAVSFTAGALLLHIATAHAGIVDVSAQSTDSSSVSIDTSQKDIRNVSSDLINNQGPFAALAGHPFTSTLGISTAKNVLQVKVNAAGDQITITDPRTGQTKEITAPTKEQAQQQLNTFLKTELNPLFGGYQKVINDATYVGVTDGNPLAATALFADDVFNQFGLIPTVPQAGKTEIGRFEVGVSGDAGSYTSSVVSGNFAKLDLNASVKITDRIGVGLSIPFEYRTIGGTNTYIGGLNLGLPITILRHDAVDDGLAWQLTPWVSAGGGVNEPLLSGGGVVSTGGTSSLAYQWGAFTFTLADQLGYDTGFDFQLDGIDFSTPVNQWVLKNGLRADYQFANIFFTHVGLSYTNFLASAAVRNYFTPTCGVGVRWGPGGASEFELSYVGNFGDSYRDNVAYGSANEVLETALFTEACHEGT